MSSTPHEVWERHIEELEKAMSRARNPKLDRKHETSHTSHRRGGKSPRRGGKSPTRIETYTEKYHRKKKEEEKEKERQKDLERKQRIDNNHHTRVLHKIREDAAREDAVREREERERTHETVSPIPSDSAQVSTSYAAQHEKELNVSELLVELKTLIN